MITKESNSVRKCCLYASDFHLEMILLPYIKEGIDKSKFLIITQNDLSETIKILLDRVNIEKKHKKEILNLNWKKTNIEDLKYVKELINKNDDIHIIVNGDYKYINEINDNLILLYSNNVNIIDCFNINDKNIDLSEIKNNYNEVINTRKI